MERSTVSEITLEARKELGTDDYWNDMSDNIEVIRKENIDSTTENRFILNDNRDKKEKLDKLHDKLLSVVEKSDEQISPNLMYDIFMFPKIVDFEKDSIIEKKSDLLFQDKDANQITTKNNLEKRSAIVKAESSLAVLQR